ncbi:MAG: type II toxin-antitoxin system Phd/YefM family antitoxin [Hydrococcus sp. Prado102]|jgi:PHD/YefM family antitoxin component YafN of YafNO toxin-antitoxin module|nr:type II toxin-antitoxin system Phd/YefM family antitoxin [Hydrococcus sp. Prado102]
MQEYTLTDIHARQDEVFDLASVEPVLLTDLSHPSHVLMSVKTYKQLIERLQELEDRVLGQAAQAAISQSRMVGIEKFTSTLEHLANG